MNLFRLNLIYFLYFVSMIFGRENQNFGISGVGREGLIFLKDEESYFCDITIGDRYLRIILFRGFMMIVLFYRFSEDSG